MDYTNAIAPTSWLFLQLGTFTAAALGFGLLIGYGMGYESGLKKGQALSAQPATENTATGAPGGYQKGRIAA